MSSIPARIPLPALQAFMEYIRKQQERYARENPIKEIQYSPQMPYYQAPNYQQRNEFTFWWFVLWRFVFIHLWYDFTDELLDIIFYFHTDQNWEHGIRKLWHDIDQNPWGYFTNSYLWEEKIVFSLYGKFDYRYT